MTSTTQPNIERRLLARRADEGGYQGQCAATGCTWFALLPEREDVETSFHRHECPTPSELPVAPTLAVGELEVDPRRVDVASAIFSTWRQLGPNATPQNASGVLADAALEVINSRSVGEDSDDEQFCGRCAAGVDSDEHHAKCVVPGYALDGEPAEVGGDSTAPETEAWDAGWCPRCKATVGESQRVTIDTELGDREACPACGCHVGAFRPAGSVVPTDSDEAGAR